MAPAGSLSPHSQGCRRGHRQFCLSEDLELKWLHALTTLREERRAQRRSSPGAAGPAAVESPGWSGPRPWDLGGYRKEKRKGFTGRRWLFEQVRAWHHQAQGSPALRVVADFGVGPSAFMVELCEGSAAQAVAN